MPDVEVELPQPLVEHLLASQSEDLGTLLARLLEAGVTHEIPPEPTGPASDPDPVRRKRQAADGLTHYVARAWYLATAVARLRTMQAEMERELDRVEGST